MFLTKERIQSSSVEIRSRLTIYTRSGYQYSPPRTLPLGPFLPIGTVLVIKLPENFFLLNVEKMLVRKTEKLLAEIFDKSIYQWIRGETKRRNSINDLYNKNFIL